MLFLLLSIELYSKKKPVSTGDVIYYYMTMLETVLFC